ncbi:non-specific lipid-transfer protein 1-like [Mangifera indica]|uniref:non-specific lipid-transfer protein 1-like n=1 Tax=Mangifera indica TaxID=29780 RepID=UPI001CFA473D|nr:non-specific lipid-transfer protein 1-like [Mangifera indica]
MGSSLKLVCILVLCMLVTAPLAHAIDCNQVNSELAACVDYLKTDGEGAVPAACCSGLQAVDNSAQTTEDRQKICECLEKDAESTSGINTETASELPSKCGITISYSTSGSTNCSSIQ